ncbi:MAG TPA: hypothetical protein VI488_17050 [Candidatus Angelobacter sp.]
MEQQKRFYVALAMYAVIGLLIWLTIDNIPIPLPPEMPIGLHITLRQVALAILGLFVLRTVLHWHAERIRAEREKEEVSS